jgi:PAS domain S-box-containing protein
MPPARPYAVAVAAVAVALALDASPLLLVPAVVAAGWAGGLWPAIAATALATAGLHPSNPPEVSLPFAAVGGAVAVACETLHAARRRAERAAREAWAADDRVRRVAAAVGGMVYELDVPTWRVERSAGLAEVAGFAPGEVPPTPEWWVGRIHPDDRPGAVDLFEEARRVEDAPTRTEYRVRHKDGDWRHVEDRAVLLRDAAGRVVKMTGCTTDVTDRVRAAAELRDAQARLKAALSAGEVATWTWDVRADRVTADRNMARLFGVSDADADGGPGAAYLAAVHPDDRDRVGTVIGRSLAEGGSYEMTYRVRPADGRYRWVIGRGRVELGPDGRAARLSGVAVDITRQKSAEDALRASEERYRAFVANTAEGVYRLEFDPPIDTALPPEAQVESVYRAGRVAEGNDAFARMSGFAAAADVVGLGLAAMLPPDDPAAREYLLAVVRAGYRVTDVESAGRDKDGRPVVFANSVVGVVEGGKLVRVWGTRRAVPARDTPS